MTKIHLFTFGVPGLLGPAITSVIAEHRISDATFTPLSGNLVLMTWEEKELATKAYIVDKVEQSEYGPLVHGRVIEPGVNEYAALDKVITEVKRIRENHATVKSDIESFEEGGLLKNAERWIRDYRASGAFDSLVYASTALIRALDVDLIHKPNDNT